MQSREESEAFRTMLPSPRTEADLCRYNALASFVKNKYDFLFRLDLK